jgi:hypothetical protein
MKPSRNRTGIRSHCFDAATQAQLAAAAAFVRVRPAEERLGSLCRKISGLCQRANFRAIEITGGQSGGAIKQSRIIHLSWLVDDRRRQKERALKSSRRRRHRPLKQKPPLSAQNGQQEGESNAETR